MNRIKFGTGFTVFVIFFGIAFLDAIVAFNWLRMVFWVGMAFLFLFADNLKNRKLP